MPDTLDRAVAREDATRRRVADLLAAWAAEDGAQGRALD